MPKEPKGGDDASSPALVPEARPGQAGGKRDQNRRARTRALVDAAVPLLLERGVEAVRIDDITKAAGVAKGSFYRYFPDKRALVAHILAPGRAEVLMAFERCEERLKDVRNRRGVTVAYTRLGRELATALMTHPQPTRIYLQERGAPTVGARGPIGELEQEIAERALALTDVAFEHGLLRRVHPQVSTLAVFGAAERLLTAYFRGELKVNPTQAIQELVTIVVEGMQGGSGGDGA